MNISIEQAIEQIHIEDMENGITKKNKRYFIFNKIQPRCLRSKKAPLQLSLMIGCFISTFLIKENSIYNLSMVFATFLLCVWYLYDARFARYYQKAVKASMFSRNEKVLKYFIKILCSKRIYVEGMPLAYNILKAKEMLIKQDVQTADFLADNALKQIADCPEAIEIKRICRNEKKNQTNVSALLNEAIQI